MFASVQARLQFSHRSFAGRLQALVRISLSSLKALRKAHTSGNVVSTAQPTRTVWEKALRTPNRPRSREARAGRVSAVSAGASKVVVIRASQLDPVAAGGPRRDEP